MNHLPTQESSQTTEQVSAGMAYVQTFGCQMNEYDTRRMEEILKREGYSISNSPDGCDLVLLNTCSVRENPENKVYSQLGRIRDLKRKNPNMLIGVGGCVAQQEGENILIREKSVDIVFGTDQYSNLPAMIKQAYEGKRVLNIGWMPREKKIQNFVNEDEIKTGQVVDKKAYVSITKGCDNFCSFCIVPFTRGREVSREADNILTEVQNLVTKGAKEIMLLGQNVNSYRAGETGFYELLEEVSKVEGLKRLRFTSPHPKDWNNRLTDLMAENKVICDQLHLPFQSGSSRIVELMRRGHTTEQYLEKIYYLKEKIPHIGLSTDIIVGFPTETDDDYQETLEVLKLAKFSQIYAFKYSPRPGTRASKLEDDVPREIKEKRLAKLFSTQQEVQREVYENFIGWEGEVLIDGSNPKFRHWMNGKLSNNIPVSIEDCAAEVGDFVTVKIDSARPNILIGRLI